jgi:hypothetical protein
MYPAPFLTEMMMMMMMMQGVGNPYITCGDKAHSTKCTSIWLLMQDTLEWASMTQQ